VYRQAWEAITDGAKTSPEDWSKKRTIRVGKPYIQGETSQEEGVQYSWDPISHVLVFFFRNPQPHEVQAIKSGEAEFALVVKQDIIFLLSHFKGVLHGQKGTDCLMLPIHGTCFPMSFEEFLQHRMVFSQKNRRRWSLSWSMETTALCL
jgi:hypothetical protein